MYRYSLALQLSLQLSKKPFAALSTLMPFPLKQIHVLREIPQTVEQLCVIGTIRC